MKYILGLLLALILTGCTEYYPTHVLAPKDPHLNTLHFSVWIDKDFSSQERFLIEEGLGDWNQALNGYLDFQIVDDRIEVTDATIDKVKTEHLSVLFIQQAHNPVVGSDTIAFADGIPGHIVTIYSDRFAHVAGRQVVAHELGHILGARHNTVPHSLMNENGFVMQSPCIDGATMKEVVAEHQWMGLKYTNYCLNDK